MSASTLGSDPAGSVHTYAAVAFETALKEWLDGLGQVSAALDRTPGLPAKLSDSGKPFETRQQMLLSLLPKDMPQPVRNFLFAMLANGDIASLDEVLEALRHMAAEAGGPRALPAEVTSAVELTNQEREGIQQRLVDEFGPDLDFRFKVDPAILGGLVIRVGDKLLDRSVASRMSALRQSLGVTGG